MSNVISEYMGADRKAIIRKAQEGFEVDLYLDQLLVETRKVHNHSETYAENVAENYVQNMFDAVEKEGSFYGYNEKSRNFDPEVDD